MPLDGSGSYNRPPTTVVQDGQLITALTFNLAFNDIKQALDTAVYRDGQAALQGDLSAGNFKITNLALPTGPNEAARKIDLQQFNQRLFTTPVNVVTSAPQIIDSSASNVFFVPQLTIALTTVTIQNSVSGQVLYIRFVQDALGNKNINFTNALIRGTLDLLPSSVSWLQLTYVQSVARWEGLWLTATSGGSAGSSNSNDFLLFQQGIT